jgi:opacity protein-like surface antigen
MKMSRVIILAFALGAAACSARADFYSKLGALYNTPGDLKVDGAGAFKASLNSSLGYTAAVGYKFSLLRAEAEVQYFKSSTDSASNASRTGVTVTGDEKQYNAFLNGYLDLPSFFGLAPYAGAGIGYSRVDLEQLSALQGSTSVVQMGSRGRANAYQFMGGLEFHVLGKATLNVGYRFMHKGPFPTRNYASNLRQNVSWGVDKMVEVGLAWGF